MASFLKKLSLLIKSIKSEGQMKNFQSNVSILVGGGGVIYVHFYKWDKSLDFVLVVYDLMELIIEVSY